MSKRAEYMFALYSGSLAEPGDRNPYAGESLVLAKLWMRGYMRMLRVRIEGVRQCSAIGVRCVTYDLPAALVWLVSLDGAAGGAAAKGDSVTPLWQLFVSGAVGSSLTYAFTWWRERRRTKDAYHAPQRAAIGDIVTATATVMLNELESRTYLTGLLERDQQGQSGDPDFDETKTPTAALAKATLDAERAFQIGSLNIVDAPCFEAFGAAYLKLTLLRKAMADTTKFSTAQHIEQYVTAIHRLSGDLSTAVTGLVNVANQRITPAETIWNRRDRNKARQRLGQSHNLSLLASDGQS